MKLLFAFVLCLLIALVNGQLLFEDKYSERRLVTYRFANDSLLVLADPLLPAQKNRLEVSFTTLGYPQLRLANFAVSSADQLPSNNQTSNFTIDPTQAWFSFRFVIRALVEVAKVETNMSTPSTSNDANANASELCVGKDSNILSKILMVDLDQWTPLQETIQIFNQSSSPNATDNSTVSNANNTVEVRMYETNLTQTATFISIKLWFSDAPVSLPDGTTLAPGKVKIDLQISNYTFVANDSKLALLTLIQSKDPIVASPFPKEIYLNKKGEVSWHADIIMDMRNMSVNISFLEWADLQKFEDGKISAKDTGNFTVEDQVAVVAFCLDDGMQHSSRYVWSPYVGIFDNTTSINIIGTSTGTASPSGTGSATGMPPATVTLTGLPSLTSIETSTGL
jgi:hypothetical protein